MDNLTNHRDATTLTPVRTLYTVEEFVRLPQNAFLSAASMRHLLFNSKQRYPGTSHCIPGNGLAEAGAIIRLGRKVLIDAPKFQEWLNSQRATAESN